MPVVRKVSAKAGRYLVFPANQPVLQLRLPKALVACRNVPPLRISLGPVSRREARRLADELVVIARRLFEQARRTMETEDESNIGSPEWIAGLKAHLLTVLALVQNPPPPPTPLAAATSDAIGSLVEINREVGKGDAANPVLVANAERLRKVYYDRLIALGRLNEALKARVNDDALYAALAALDGGAHALPTDGNVSASAPIVQSPPTAPAAAPVVVTAVAPIAVAAAPPAPTRNADVAPPV
jgi:hypothetical protein